MPGVAEDGEPLNPGESFSAAPEYPKPIAPKATFCPAYHLGVGFFLVFAALMPTQYLLTSLNGTLGYYSIAVLYFCMAFSGPVVPFGIQYFGGPKTALVAGSLTYLIFQVANILIGIPSIPSAASYVVLLPPSALLGIGACLLWTAEGSYAARVSRSVDEYQRSLHLENEQTSTNSLGYVNGVVLLFLQGANLIMNLASSALLSSGASAVTLFIILAAMCGAGCFTLMLLPKAPEYAENRVQQSLRESLWEMITLHKDRDFLFLMPLILTLGFNQGYLFSTITGDIITPSLGEEWIGYVMATSAAVDALGSYAFGYVSDKIGRYPVLAIGFLTNLGGCIVVIVMGVPDKAYVMAFAVAVLLGIADAVWMTVTSAMLAEQFRAPKTTAAFAIFTSWRSFCTALMSLLGPFLPLSVRTAILAGSVLLAAITASIPRHRPAPMA